MFIRARKKWYQRDMNKERILSSYLQRDLPGCFNERLRFDIADGPADLRNDDISGSFSADCIDKILDLIGDMGYDLHR